MALLYNQYHLKIRACKVYAVLTWLPGRRWTLSVGLIVVKLGVSPVASREPHQVM